MRNLVCIAISITILLSSCGRRGKPEQFSAILTDSTMHSPILNVLTTSLDLSIENTSKDVKRFYITPAKYNFHSYSELVAGIVDTINVNGYGNAERLWQLVKDYTTHSTPIMNERLPHDPLRLVNSFQSGLCDDRNTALAKLFELAGLPSRVYHLDGHVVAEAFFNNSWHMYDADWGVYFRTENDVADVAYASKHPEVIKLWKEHGYVVGKLIGPAILKHVYTTTENNKVNTWFGDVKLDYKNEMELRPGDELQMHIEKMGWEGQVRMLVGKHAVTDTRHWGSLNRKVVAIGADFTYTEDSPYAITEVSINSNDAKAKPVAVYYSYNGDSWAFKGLIGGGSKNVSFAPKDGNGEKVVFGYQLKFVPLDGGNMEEIYTVKNKILFSEKVLLNEDQSFRIVPISGTGKVDVRLQSSSKGVEP